MNEQELDAMQAEVAAALLRLNDPVPLLVAEAAMMHALIRDLWRLVEEYVVDRENEHETFDSIEEMLE